MNKKVSALVFLVGSLIVLLWADSFFGWSKKEVVSESMQTDTSNWKTYTNDKYGFEFKYPLSYSYDESSVGEDVFPNSTQVNVFDNNHSGFSLFVNQPASGQGDSCDNVKQETVVIGEIRMDRKDECNFITYLFKSKNDEFVFATLDFYDPLIVQVLSTFKFTEPVVKVDTSNWKTYSNSQYGFEFKYPSDFHLKEKPNGISIKSSVECVYSEYEWPENCFGFGLLIQKNKIISEGRGINHILTTVAGYPAERIEGHEVDFGSTSSIIQFNKLDDWYISTATYNLKDTVVSESILDQMLSTFKFTK